MNGKSSLVLSKDKKIVEDLNRIKEINSIMKLGNVDSGDSLIQNSLYKPSNQKVLGDDLQQMR